MTFKLRSVNIVLHRDILRQSKLYPDSRK